MIKFENTEVMGWEAAIRGMRNPMNSWGKSDSCFGENCSPHFCSDYCGSFECEGYADSKGYSIGPNDYDLMMRLSAGGPVHAKYRRMITVYVDVTAPLYWWKEFDTYKVGTVANSCSTMHKIADKEFTLEDFSCEHLKEGGLYILNSTIDMLNKYRLDYLNPEAEKLGVKKDYWWQMIQLLPSSYNQRRTVMINYEVLAHIWNDRKNHKLDEWAEHPKVFHGNDGFDMDSKTGTIKNMYRDYFGFCDWIKTLPYHEIITQEEVLMSAE